MKHFLSKSEGLCSSETGLSDPTKQSKMTDLLRILNLPGKQLHPNTGAILRERNCYQYVRFILISNAPTETFLC